MRSLCYVFTFIQLQSKICGGGACELFLITVPCYWLTNYRFIFLTVSFAKVFNRFLVNQCRNCDVCREQCVFSYCVRFCSFIWETSHEILTAFSLLQQVVFFLQFPCFPESSSLYFWKTDALRGMFFIRVFSIEMSRSFYGSWPRLHNMSNITRTVIVLCRFIFAQYVVT